MDELLSSFAFNFSLRPCAQERILHLLRYGGGAAGVPALAPRGRLPVGMNLQTRGPRRKPGASSYTLRDAYLSRTSQTLLAT